MSKIHMLISCLHCEKNKKKPTEKFEDRHLGLQFMNISLVGEASSSEVFEISLD